MAGKKGFFEQKIKEASPGYVKGEQKKVGQREWNPTPVSDGIGAHTSTGYNAQTTKVPTGPPPKKSLSDLP